MIATEWIGNKVGITLPPEFLFVFRSIDAVTNALLAGEYKKASSPSRPLTQTPIFLFPGAGGIDEPALIRFREQATPRMNFEVVPIDKWHHWIDRRYNFEDLATQAAQYVNANSPQGPIRLAGYSQGGQLAYVTALALENMGRNVEVVCMIDTETNERNVRSVSKDSIFTATINLCRKYIAGKTRGRALFPPGRKWNFFIAWLWEKRGGPELVIMLVRSGRLVLTGRAKVRGESFIQMRVFAKMWGDWAEKNKAHILQKISIVLFRSEDPGSPDLGWRAYCSNVKVVPVEGDHRSMLASQALVSHFVTEVGDVTLSN